MEGVYRYRVRRNTDQHEGAVAFQEREAGVEIVRRGNGIDEEIEMLRPFLHRFFVVRDHDLVRAQAHRVGCLPW